MVSKKVKFTGASIADRLGQLSNFICSDGDNLKWNPSGLFDSEKGIAENRFRVSEYMAPIWNKVTIIQNKTATYGEHSGLYQISGLDNLGLETPLYERSILSTTAGADVYITIDMLKSACASALTKDTQQSTIINNTTFEMPLLKTSYDDISLQAAWFDPNWTKRKGIPIQESPQKLRGYGQYNGVNNNLPQNSVDQDFWYFIVDVTYDADMQADFDDIRFCGFDGVTELAHWQISKTDSTTAKYLILMPWYFGFREQDQRKIWVNYGYYYGIAEAQQNVYSNVQPKYVWMYYGNSSASSESDSTLDNNTWFTDLFDDASLTWSTSGTAAGKTIAESGGYLTGTITAGNTGTIYAYEEFDTDAIGESFDVIWNLNDYYKTSSGAYRHIFGIGTDTSNYVALAVTHESVYAFELVAAAETQFVTGEQVYEHDDNAPLYIRMRINNSNTAAMQKGITFEISKDCRKWDQVIHLLDTTDIDNNVSNATTLFYGESVTSAAAGNCYTNINWVQMIPCNNNAGRYEFIDNCEFSDFPYRWTGSNYSAGNKTWTRDYTNSEIDFAIANNVDARWEGATDAAPRLNLTLDSALYYGTTTIFEVKLTKHARTTNGASRAGIAYASAATSHIDVHHQLYQDAQYDENMKMIRTLDASDVTMQEQQYGAEPISEGPIWMRLIHDTLNQLIVGEYSRDGYNWITLGANNINEFKTATSFHVYLKNGGAGNSTASFEYVRLYQIAGPYNMGESFTAEQAYTDYDDIAPEASKEYVYTDDFEDNKYTGRTYPYRDYTKVAGTLAIESAAPITGTYSLKHTGNGSDSALNQVFFKDNNIAYTATFNFKLSTQGVGGGTPYVRLWEPRASPSLTDGTIICVDTIWDGANQKLRLVEYDRRSGTQITSVTWIAGSKLGTATTYAFEIIDTGKYITVKIDGTTYLDTVSYGSRATVKKLIPGRYKAFGANVDSAGRWDDIVITPSDSTRTYDRGNEVEFILPSTYVRNQPMKIGWKNQGSDIWNYSKSVYISDTFFYQVGATDLDKYIGMKTKIIFEGDSSDSLEIKSISYEYEV